MRVKPSFAAIMWFVVGASAWPTAAPAADDVCAPPGHAEPVHLAGLDRHGDLLLSDGRVVRLAGLAPRQSDAERERFAARLARWHGRAFLLTPLGAADRWGRLPARLEAMPDAPTAIDGHADLTAAMLAGGAALRLPEPGFAACNEIWRRAEPQPLRSQDARAAAAATLPVVDGHDPAAMRAQAGRIVVVEGRIAAVGERAQRTYLNFERRRGAGGSIVLSRALWRELQRSGWTASALTGKRVRIRGVIEGRDSLLIEAEARSALEMID